MKSREEIVDTLKVWIAEGRLISKVGLGIPYHEIERQVASGDYLATSAQGILCTDAKVKEAFEEFWDQKRVMDGIRLGAVMGYVTVYSVTKAIAEGRIERVDLDGKKSILYVV